MKNKINFAKLASYIRQSHELQKDLKALASNMLRTFQIYEDNMQKIYQRCNDLAKLLGTCVNAENDIVEAPVVPAPAPAKKKSKVAKKTAKNTVKKTVKAKIAKPAKGKLKRIVFKFPYGFSVDFPNYKTAYMHFAGCEPPKGCRYGVPHRKAVDPRIVKSCRFQFFRDLIGGERKLKEIVEV